AVYKSVIRAKALDTLRGLLPAATLSNVGLFGTGQAFEALLLRMFAHRLEEVRGCAQLMLTELRQVIPAFLARLDQPDRGGRWTDYIADTRRAFEALTQPLLSDTIAEPRGEVTLTDFDPEGETKVVAAALYPASALPDDQLLALARRLSADDRTAILRAYVGGRANRRHKPGRAFERTSYRFDVLADYGAFRDLQRHPSYRRVCQLMHRAIADEAGHRAIADAMQFVDHSEVELERLHSERQMEKKRRATG